jgi:hypothetical protein
MCSDRKADHSSHGPAPNESRESDRDALNRMSPICDAESPCQQDRQHKTYAHNFAGGHRERDSSGSKARGERGRESDRNRGLRYLGDRLLLRYIREMREIEQGYGRRHDNRWKDEPKQRRHIEQIRFFGP